MITRYIVAFTGRRGHGKTTAAQALEKLGYVHVNFADPLRQVAHIAYGITLEEMLDTKLKETPLDRFPFKSPREVLQYVGTEMFRTWIDTTWTEAFKRKVAGYSHVVCSDLRFPNEAECLRSLADENTIVKIVRVVDPRWDRDDAAAQHSSETSMDQILSDVVIRNAGTVEQLHGEVLSKLRMSVGM